MKLSRKLVVALAATFIGTSAAVAAEPMYGAVGGQWSGLYVGGFIARANTGPSLATGAQVGYNFQPGRMIVGVEARIGNLVGGGSPFTDIRGKVGVAVGATGNMMVYGVGSLGNVLTGPPYFTIGAGIAFGFGRVSAFVESIAIAIGAGTLNATAVQAGVNFHFN